VSASKDLVEFVTDELLKVRQRVQTSLSAEDEAALPDAHDAYVSALIGHLFTALLTGFGPAITGVDRSPENLARALATIGKKVSLVAENLDPTSDYRIQILRREKSAGSEPV
jgi:hypothetical protein